MSLKILIETSRPFLQLTSFFSQDDLIKFGQISKKASGLTAQLYSLYLKPTVLELEKTQLIMRLKQDEFFCSFVKLDEFFDRFSVPLCQAQQITRKCNQMGIPVLYTAQKTDIIFWQITMKQVYEKLHGNLRKHCKVLRVDSEEMISDMRISSQTSDTLNPAYKSMICASINICDCTPQESMIHYLAGGKSGMDSFQLQPELNLGLKKIAPNLKTGLRMRLARQVCEIVKPYEIRLPGRLIEILILRDPDPRKYIRICADYGTQVESPITDPTSFLLSENAKSGTNFPLQARVLAPRPSLSGIKTLRLLNKKDRQILKQIKGEIREAISTTFSA